jgi:hypothetical protein
MSGLQLEEVAHPDGWLETIRFLSGHLTTGEKATSGSQTAQLSHEWALVGCDLARMWVLETQLSSTYDLYLVNGEMIPISSPTGC